MRLRKRGGRERPRPGYAGASRVREPWSAPLDAAMLLVLVALYRRQRYALRDLGLRLTSGPRAVGLTFAAVAAYLGIAGVRALVVLGQHRHEIAPQLHLGTPGLVVAGVSLCCVSPVTEELFFRGFLYRVLRDRLNVIWIAPAAAEAFGVVVLVRHRLRPATADELAAWQRHLGPPLPDHAVGMRSRSSAQSGARMANRITQALVTRFGYHSPQWVLGMTGGLLVIVGFVIVAVGVSAQPGTRTGHSTADGLLGIVILIGLVMIAAAILWRLFRRPSPLRPKRRAPG